MATRLKDTDVVIIGLGAAGGVAALPLAQAGLEVIGLEAGTWLTAGTSRPTKCATTTAAGRWRCRRRKQRSADRARRTPRRTDAARGGHPMMNAVGGTALHYWAQSWRLNPWDFKVVSETTKPLRRVAHSERVDGRRLAVRLRGARAVLRQGRVRDRRLRPGRQRQREDRRARQHLRGAAQARVPDAAAALDRLSSRRWRTPRERSAGIRSPGRPRSTRAPTRTVRLHVSRLLQHAAAATSTRRTRRRSRRFRARRRRAASRW